MKLIEDPRLSHQFLILPLHRIKFEQLFFVLYCLFGLLFSFDEFIRFEPVLKVGVLQLNKIDHGYFPVVTFIQNFFVFDKLELVAEAIADDNLALVVYELGVVVNEDMVAGVIPLDRKEDGN